MGCVKRLHMQRYARYPCISFAGRLLGITSTQDRTQVLFTTYLPFCCPVNVEFALLFMPLHADSRPDPYETPRKSSPAECFHPLSDRRRPSRAVGSTLSSSESRLELKVGGAAGPMLKWDAIGKLSWLVVAAVTSTPVPCVLGQQVASCNFDKHTPNVLQNRLLHL